VTESDHLTQSTQTPAADAALLERAMFEVKRVIVGQERMVERLVVSLLAQGHCLLEGVPGVAKTLAVETLAKTVTGTFSRLQFTPDLVPSDIVGTRIYRPGSESFDTELGPIMANFVLADEINRAPAKVQSAMLEVMAEKHVTIGGKRFDVPRPFLVLATQNPIESEGVYPLPEAQRDRFLMKIVVDYPTAAEEREIIYRMGSQPPVANGVLSTDDLQRLQATTSRVFVHHAIVDYVVRLVLATRHPEQLGLSDVKQWISYGASPRASLGLIAAGRAMALTRGRDYVLPQDVLDIAVDVLAHRLVLSYDAIADGVPSAHPNAAAGRTPAAFGTAGHVRAAARSGRPEHGRAAAGVRPVGAAAVAVG
jgi:MoxR-like ATPase